MQNCSLDNLLGQSRVSTTLFRRPEKSPVILFILHHSYASFYLHCAVATSVLAYKSR